MVQKFNLKDFKLNGQDLKLELNMVPLKDVIKSKKYGKTIIPFSCSLKAAKMEIPDYVAQKNF